ncbi:MAG: outer membrane protein assembly factor BamD [Phenylobacterium sp.]|nr:outer membrane protein assembly factor BamD [Phenylobacterium sp.]
MKVYLVRKSSRVVLVAAACALALSACSGNKKNKPRLAYEERPVELLYATGANRLDRRQWAQAVAYFQEVERQHPYSEWSRRSILMQAYAHYESNDYAEAIGDADRFIQLYPGNPTAAYAHYIKAICYFEQIVDVNRDQAATAQALEALRDVVQRYPRTEYASDARLKIDMVNDQLAGKDMTIGRWYLRNGDTLAAANRFKTVVDRYQTTSHTPEALYRLVETYLTLGLLEEAKRNGAVLGYNYPGDPWYNDAYKLLTSKGLRPAVEPKSGGRGFMRLPFTKDKQQTVKPPAVAAAPESTTEAATTAEAPAPAETAAVDAPKKKRFRLPFTKKD